MNRTPRSRRRVRSDATVDKQESPARGTKVRRITVVGLVLALALIPSSGFATAASASGPHPAVVMPSRSTPETISGFWYPLRGSTVVGCTWNNGCDGGYHGYPALDLARNPSGSVAGDPVFASANGTAHITSRGTRCGGTPNSVRVDHAGGVSTSYSHLQTISVADGATVTPNTVIGRVGNTGDVRPCGPASV